MKRIFTLIAAVLLMATVWAQSPQKMSYQAVIRNGSGVLVTTPDQVGMRISILRGSDTGPVSYTKTLTTTPNASGLVNIEIGGEAGFDTIKWATGSYFIKIETDPSGPGTNYTITGTSQMLSVPYALYAKTAGGHYIGELFGGGIVVSVWKSGGVEHGLIASSADISGAAAWSDVINLSSGALSALDGMGNTNAIFAQSATAPAAQMCKSYNAGGFNDWYLPAIWELKECYSAEFIVNTVLGAANGFQFAAYWSSTENSPTLAWYLLFNTGIMGSDALKSNNGRVRAVRKF